MDFDTVTSSNPRVAIMVAYDDENVVRVGQYEFRRSRGLVQVWGDGDHIDDYRAPEDRTRRGLLHSAIDWYNASEDAKWLGVI